MSPKPPPQPDDDSDPPGGVVGSWIRQGAQVFEFLATLGVLGFVGWKLDERYKIQPWGLLGGLLLGMGVGLYLMLRESKRLDR
jgi:F0F1-type ATP synthase assembly protein I